MSKRFVKITSISLLVITFSILVSIPLGIVLNRFDRIEINAQKTNLVVESVKESVYRENNKIDLKLDNIETGLSSNIKEVKNLVEIERSTLAKKVIVSRGGLEREFRVTPQTLENLEMIKMRATAYDLSEESCAKSPSHPEYGITKSGERVIYKTTVAVDPTRIPLGSVLYIEFPKKYSYMNGIYVAMDTGSAVKKDIIDIYVGEHEPELCSEFGAQKVKVYIMG